MLKANQSLKKGQRLREVEYKGKIFKVNPKEKIPNVSIKNIAMGKRLSRRTDTV